MMIIARNLPRSPDKHVFKERKKKTKSVLSLSLVPIDVLSSVFLGRNFTNKKR
jgi:hypothetical protein